MRAVAFVRRLHAGRASMASAELARLAESAIERRSVAGLAEPERAQRLVGELRDRMSVLEGVRGAAAPGSDEVAAARADALELVSELARCGPDTSAMPVRRLYDIESYGHLGDGPLSGFLASELFQGAAVLASDADAGSSELLAAVATEAAGRVDEFPVHALASLAQTLVGRGSASTKTFVRAATVSAAKRAHAPVTAADALSLLRSAATAGVQAPELAAEVGTTLAVAAETAEGRAALSWGDIADGVALVLASSPAGAFKEAFGSWAVSLVRSSAGHMGGDDLERVVLALRGEGLGGDPATGRALRADAARRARDEAAAAANGFTPEDYGVAPEGGVVRS